MKIVTLNTWGGRAGKDLLLSFFEEHKNDIDVFCLQEIWSAPHTHLDGHDAGGVPIDHKNIMTHGMQDKSETLSEHVGYFRPHFGDNYGLMMFVRKGLEVIAEGEIFVYKEKGYVPDGDLGNHARNIQHITLLINNNPVTIINFHGLWNGNGKTDTEDRLNQSKNIIKFIDSLNSECVFCGDFNLLPHNKSIKLFEEYGLTNLIKENEVQSTRTSFYTKPEKYADYIFVSKGISVKDFKVMPDEVSDHLPLYLEI
jgi:endonuclease/exonuclease/phosphatase family metal-dependent hydrolase